MTMAGRLRSASFVVLCLGLVAACGLFGAPLGFKPSVRWALVLVQAPLLCGAAWMSGLDLMRSSGAPQRRQLVAAMLLILPIALFSLMPGFGPPEFTDPTHNAYRYEVLFVDVVLVATGLLVLHDALRAVGEETYARLGLALGVWATALYLVWSTLLLAGARAFRDGRSWSAGPWNDWLMAFSDHLLFFGGLLTYLASALFAVSLRRAGWIGTKAALAFVAVSALAAFGLIVRGIDFPDPAVVFSQGYSIPGWIAGIPAVPWLMPCIFGLILLRRAGRGEGERVS